MAGRTPTAMANIGEITPEGQRFVKSAFAELSPVQRQILELAYFSGLRQNEIAALLSIPLQSVRLGMLAALGKLREAL